MLAPGLRQGASPVLVLELGGGGCWGSGEEWWERWRRLLRERPRPDTSSVPPCFSQVSRFLVVSPQRRCSAEEALAHPFFQQYVVEEVRHFSPRGKFKVLRAHLPLRAPETQAPSALHTDSLRPPALPLPSSPMMVPAQFLPASVADSLKACACGSGGNGGNWGAGGGGREAVTVGRAQPTPHKAWRHPSSGRPARDAGGDRPGSVAQRSGPAPRR